MTTTANPLVAQRQDSTQWYHGLGLIESVNDTANGIESGSWIDTSLGVVGAGLDTLGLVLDPVGSVVSWGISWLMEHLEPLSDALDALAGDPDQIAANAQTWKNVAGAVQAAAQELQEAIARDIAEWSGAAADAYRSHAAAQQEALSAISRASGAIGTGVELAGTLVGVVREIVRDLIAECITTLAVRLPMWLAEVGLTLGIGTPWVAGQVASLVAKWVNRISGFLDALIKSFRKLAPLLSKLDEIIQALKTALRRLDGSGSGGRHGTRDPHGDGSFFHSDADPLRSHGSGMSTHPDEVQAMIREAEELGIEIDYREGAMAYSPGLSPGSKGTLHIDPEASYGAWLHEMNHARDDAAAGWPGMRGWFEDPEVRIANERRAYDAEIAHARSIGDDAAAAKLEELFQAERRRILGLDEE